MKFSDIIGQEKAKTRLRTMADEDRLPHALLISGQSGVGALAMARALAQYTHCEHPVGGDSCGVCGPCLQHQSLNHPDVHYTFPYVKKKGEGLLVCDDYAAKWREFLCIGPYVSWEEWLQTSDAGNSQPVIYVEESAEIVRRMNMSNYSAKYKIAIIWLPERLQPEAANKLLKIIEEPYPDTRFIMVSQEPGAILPTIYSRTQRVELPPLGSEQIAGYLLEHHGLDSTAAHSIAGRAEGSLSSAIALIDAQGEVREFAPMFRDMMRKAYTRDVKALRSLADDIAAMGREKARRFLQYCNAQVRENFIYNMGVPALLNMDTQEMQFSSRFAPFINAANVEQLTTLFAEAEADIARNANAKIVMFDSLLQLIVLLLRKP